MRINISWNRSKSLNLPDLQETVKFTRMHFSRLWYSHEHSGKWMHAEKTWYTVAYYKVGIIIWQTLSDFASLDNVALYMLNSRARKHFKLYSYYVGLLDTIWRWSFIVYGIHVCTLLRHLQGINWTGFNEIL